MKESLKLYQGAIEEKKEPIWILEENERENQWLLEDKGGGEIVRSVVQTNLAGEFYLCNQNLHASDSIVKDNVIIIKIIENIHQNRSYKIMLKVLVSVFRGVFCLNNANPMDMMHKAPGYSVIVLTDVKEME